MKITIKQLAKKAIVAFFATAILAGGCTDKFTDFNTNPHEATDEMMERDNLLTGSFFSQQQRNVLIFGEGFDSDYQITQNLAGDIYSGYMGASGLWYSNANNTTYSLISDWYNAAFEKAYTNIMTPWYAIKQVAEEDIPQTYAIATIVKVAGMHRITDMYGPIPYNQFGISGVKVAYDSQEAVYDAFFEELDHSIEILTDFNERNPSAKVMADYDFIFDGDVRSWVRFANSLKLRLALRIVYANPGKAQQEAESAVAHPIGLVESTAYTVSVKQSSKLTFRHPLYVICYEFGDIRMGATMDSYLNGYADPRLPRFFNTATDGTFRGIRTGINITNKATYAEGPFSTLNVAPNTPVVWMNPAETYFLRAEGALRGWNMGGTAQSFYEGGVRASFDYWQVGGADNYLADSEHTPAPYADPRNDGNDVRSGSRDLGAITVKWDESDDFEHSLERIVTQKWIAMYPDGQEAWSEFRRTGYPKVFPVVVNRSNGTISSDTQIRRLPFPSTEYNDNADHVQQAAGLLNGPDNGGTSLWWDKK